MRYRSSFPDKFQHARISALVGQPYTIEEEPPSGLQPNARTDEGPQTRRIEKRMSEDIALTPLLPHDRT